MKQGMQEPGVLGKLVSVVVGLILLVVGFMFSLVFLALVVAAGLGVWIWFWWKTRKIRQQMRENTPQPSAAGGQVFEGEAVIVEEEVTRATRVSANRLPESPDHRSPD